MDMRVLGNLSTSNRLSSLHINSHMDVTLLLLSILLLFLLKHLSPYTFPWSTANSSALRLAPGPWQLPLVGSLHHLLFSRFRYLPHRAMRELSQKYGPLMLLRIGSVPTLVVSSAETAQEIMKTHDTFFCNRHLNASMDIISCGGQGILFSFYNDRWRELRKLCMLELFNKRRVLSFRPVREDEVARLICSISKEGSNGNLVHVTDKIRRMVNDTIVRIAIGWRSKHQDEFLLYFSRTIQLSEQFNLANLYPSSRFVRLLSLNTQRVVRCQRNLYRIIETIISERITTEAPEQEDLLSTLLRLQKCGGMKFSLTNEIIRTVIFDIFAAGSDTSSTVLDWAMSELMKNPRVLQKAQLELRSTFKGKEKLNEEDIAKLRYLKLVIKETLRLHAPVPLLLPRECRETCRIMGYDIQKGTRVTVNAWAIGRDPGYWGDSNVFRPERFGDGSVDFKGCNFQYIPFGAGRRICPGMMLGLANMELALASLLYHFDWKLPSGIMAEDLDMTETSGIAGRRKEKLWLHAKPHNSSIE